MSRLTNDERTEDVRTEDVIQHQARRKRSSRPVPFPVPVPYNFPSVSVRLLRPLVLSPLFLSSRFSSRFSSDSRRPVTSSRSRRPRTSSPAPHSRRERSPQRLSTSVSVTTLCRFRRVHHLRHRRHHHVPRIGGFMPWLSQSGTAASVTRTTPRRTATSPAPQRCRHWGRPAHPDRHAQTAADRRTCAPRVPLRSGVAPAAAAPAPPRRHAALPPVWARMATVTARRTAAIAASLSGFP